MMKEARKVRLMFLIPSLGCGGAERVVANLASHWAGRDWRVRIVTLSDTDSDFYRLHTSVERVGLDAVGLSHSTLAAIANNVKRVRAVRNQLTDFRPDIAIGMMTIPSVLLALSSFGCRPAVLLASERVHPPMISLPRLWRLLRKVFYRRFDAVVALTNESARWILDRTWAKAAVVIGNPVVLTVPESRSDEKEGPYSTLINRGKSLFIGVGRMEHQKGFDLLLHAFARIAAQIPDWGICIVGDGPERPTLESLAKELKIASRLVMPGRVANIADWIRAAHVFVLSSRFEGFPNVLLEAMALGTPVVAFDCPTGPSVLVENGVTGILVPIDDVDALAMGMLKLALDPELRRSTAHRAQYSVRERFSLEAVASKWQTLFLETLR